MKKADGWAGKRVMSFCEVIVIICSRTWRAWTIEKFEYDSLAPRRYVDHHSESALLKFAFFLLRFAVEFMTECALWVSHSWLVRLFDILVTAHKVRRLLQFWVWIIQNEPCLQKWSTPTCWSQSFWIWLTENGSFASWILRLHRSVTYLMTWMWHVEGILPPRVLVGWLSSLHSADLVCCLLNN